MPIRSILKKLFPLILVLVSAGLLRFFGINYGLPYVVGPDETRQCLDTLGMAGRMSILPLDYTYGSLHKYLLLLLFGSYFAIGRLFGLFSSRLDFLFQFFVNPHALYLLARVLSVFLALVTVLLLYKTGARLKDRFAGLSAASLFAVNFHMVQLSYWGSSDMLLVFLSTSALYFLVVLISGQPARYAYLSAFSAGLAISAKFQGVILGVPLYLVILLVFLRKKELLLTLFLSTLCLISGALIGNLHYIFNLKAAYLKLVEVFSASQLGISSAPVFGHSFFGAVLWFFSQLLIQDGPMAGLFIIATIASLRFIKDKFCLAFICFLTVFFILFSRSSLRFLYYGALLFPWFCLAAAYILSGFAQGSYFKKSACLILLIAVASFSFLDNFAICLKRIRPDTRQLAKEWIEENIASATAIALDWPELNVQLASSLPPMVRSGSAEKFYLNYLPQDFRKKYAEFTTMNATAYEVIPALFEEKDSYLPQGLPPEIRERINKNYFAKLLYQRFNFHNPDYLRGRGCKYLVLSSYAYCHFLLDADPNKSGIFNPYIREDVLSNNRQAEEYRRQDEQSILFFLSKRARDFYEPLLLGGYPGLRLVKEFLPSDNNLGPRILIFEFIQDKRKDDGKKI